MIKQIKFSKNIPEKIKKIRQLSGKSASTPTALGGYLIADIDKLNFGAIIAGGSPSTKNFNLKNIGTTGATITSLALGGTGGGFTMGSSTLAQWN